MVAHGQKAFGKLKFPGNRKDKGIVVHSLVKIFSRSGSGVMVFQYQLPGDTFVGLFLPFCGYSGATWRCESDLSFKGKWEVHESKSVSCGLVCMCSNRPEICPQQSQNVEVAQNIQPVLSLVKSGCFPRRKAQCLLCTLIKATYVCQSGVSLLPLPAEHW